MVDWGKSFFRLEQQLILMVVLQSWAGVVMHGSVGTQSNGFALGANHYTYAGLFETLRSQDQVPFSLALESPFSASFVHILKPRGSSTKLGGEIHVSQL